MEKTKAIVLTLAIMVLSLFDLYSCGGDSPAPDNQATPTPSGQVVTGNMGDTLTVNDVALIVNSISRTTNGYKPPGDGNEYAIVNVTVENKGTDYLPVSGIVNFDLADRSGTSEQFALGAKYAAGFDLVTGGIIEAGASGTGELGYEVKKGAKNFTFKFTPDILHSQDYITVKIDQ